MKQNEHHGEIAKAKATTMHGIQHLFRQHALEKQASTESWHSAYGAEGGSSAQFPTKPPNERSRSVDDAGPTPSLDDVRHVPTGLPLQASFRSPTSQEYHSLGISIPRGKKSPDGRPSAACMEFGGAGVKKMSKRNVTGRRGSLEGAGSPPQGNNHAGYFPHDLDDIYEYKTDHQYFTHTGAYDDQDEHFSLASEHHRNMLFQRNQNYHSLDEYATAANQGFSSHQLEHTSNSRYLGLRNKFDNSSFVRKLTSSISQSSIDSTLSHSSSSKSTDKHHKHNHHKGHHHHSIAEMIKHLGKKAHIWPGRTRHESISESTDHSPDDLSKLNQNDQEDFRKRARSLDVQKTKRILDDCESTYNIYNKILREGNSKGKHSHLT